MTDTDTTPGTTPRVPVSMRQILHFYAPLVLTSQLMTLSGPVVNVAIGRATDPKLDFAAFWIAFTVVLFVESACLATQQATVAISEGSESLRRLAKSAFAVGLSASLTVLLIALTPVGDAVFHYIIPTTERVASLARSVLILLSPIPLFIAMRGVANGLAIRAHRTTLVASATIVRVLALSGVAGGAVLLHTGSGALAGGWAFTVGLGVEMSFILAVTRRFWRERVRRIDFNIPRLSYREIARIALPLAVAMIAWTSIRPVVNSVLGHLPDPELAQAGFGIVLPVIMFTCSPLWALHNVSLVLPHDRTDLGKVLRFTTGLAAVFAVVIGIIVLTPVKLYVLRVGFNLSPQLEATVAPALLWIALEPFALAAKAVAMGLLMKARRTRAFLIYSPIKIIVLIAVGSAVAIRFPNANGALLGTALYIGADIFDAAAYGITAWQELARGRVFAPHAPEPLEAAADSVIAALPLDDD